MRLLGAFGGLLGAFALSACQTTPAIRTQIVEKQVPVPVSCIKRADIPAEPAATGALPSDARQAADLLGALDLQLRAWGHRQAALLQACVSNAP